ncbi:IS30 family transposase [Secundilactobacillus kimchicus]
MRRNSLSYSILTSYDRGAIETLNNFGYSLQKIADTLGFSKSTIHYELQRVQPYVASLAQQDADHKRKQCGRKTTLSRSQKNLIESYLALTWSPAMVAHQLKLATSTLYNWLNNGRINFLLTDLPHRNAFQRRKKENRGTFKVEQTIENRPDKVNQRQEFGHWEVDTVLSSRGQDKTCLVTLVERQSRMLWAIKVPNRTKGAMKLAFKRFMNQFGSTVKSITVDHGKEFSGYRHLQQQYGIQVYFCHAYSPWERATNELFNRKLRYFFPKKSHFRDVSEQRLYEAVELINKRPMKLHHYQTPLEVFTDAFELNL